MLSKPSKAKKATASSKKDEKQRLWEVKTKHLKAEKGRLWATQSRRLESAIEAKGTNATALARQLGLNPSYFRQFIGGKQKSMSASIMTQAAKELDADTEWLLGRDVPAGAQPTVLSARKEKRIPLLGQATAGSDGRLIFSGEVIASLPCPPQLEKVWEPYALRIDGESMYPRYKAHEVVYVDPSREPKKGDDVVVQANVSGELSGYVKELVSINQKQVVVKQFNPEKEITFPRSDVVYVHVIAFADR